MDINPGKETEPMLKKKAAKKPKPAVEYDSQRETGVLLEQIGSNVEKIAEQVASNTTKLAKLDEIDGIKSDLSLVKMAVMENSRDTKKIESKVDKLESGQTEIKQKLDTVTEDHEKRIQKLEMVK